MSDVADLCRPLWIDPADDPTVTKLSHVAKLSFELLLYSSVVHIDFHLNLEDAWEDRPGPAGPWTNREEEEGPGQE